MINDIIGVAKEIKTDEYACDDARGVRELSLADTASSLNVAPCGLVDS